MFGLTPVRHNAVERANGYGDFYNAIDNFFNDDFFGRVALTSGFRMDVKEDDKNYIIEAELPGIKKEEISIDYHNNILYIAVNQNTEKTNEKNEESGNYIHRERRSTSMQRGIYLGEINIEGIDAKLENGILHITAPKAEAISNRPRIEIK